MKPISIGSAIKPSTSSTNAILVQTALVSARYWKSTSITSEHFNIKFGRNNNNNHVKCRRQLKWHGDDRANYKYGQRKAADFLTNATPDEFSQDAGIISPQESLRAMLDVFNRFSRTYTLKGTILSTISITILAVERFSDFTPHFFLGLLQAVIGGCLATLYVVAINQLSDVDIDKVNKKYLPLASGELSIATGILLTSLYAILGFWLGWSVNSWPLKLGLFAWFFLGTAYSVDIPLLRWKTIPVLAGVCIWLVRGVIVPILFYLHAQIYIFGRPPVLSNGVMFVSGLLSVYAIVITLFKDVPDVEGDEIYGINTIASQIGQEKVLWICVWLLTVAYGMAILIGVSLPRFWIRSIMVIGHTILGFILWRNAYLLDVKNKDATQSFYLLLWKLSYVEYFLVPFIRL